MAITLAAVLFIPAMPVPAAVPDTGLRRDLVAGARQELLRLGRTEVLPEALGDWRETIDSVLFMLFRSTELYRGPVRIMVVDDTEVFSRFYPEGTMVLSTGLLDHIDYLVFELTVDSPRRARDHTGERERKLAPFLAYNAARFALDNDFRAFCRTAETTGPSRAAADLARSIRETPEEVQNADLMARVLLDLSGYESSSYIDDYLPRLASLVSARENAGSPPRDVPLSPDERLAFLSDNTHRYEDLRDNHETVLRTLRTGTAFQDAVFAFQGIRESLPENYYLWRLEALVMHLRWLSTVPAETQFIATLFPAASTGVTAARNRFIDHAKNWKTGQPAASDVGPAPSLAGDSAYLDTALQAYRTALSVQPDPALASSFAVLLYQGANDTDTALREAETAARLEARSQSCTARANYASLLFLSGKDPAEAERILARLHTETAKIGTEAPSGGVLLAEGFPSDTRDILINRTMMLRERNDHERADQLIEYLGKLTTRQNGGTVSFRGIQLGTPATDVPDRWGPPETITYTYFSEIWTYPRLGIVLSYPPAETGSEPRVMEITIASGSPVSPGGDIRTGDTREVFERVFGEPAYRAGDRDVYLVNGMRLSVHYLFNKIRSITAGY